MRRQVTVRDRMQKGYRYLRTGPPGRNFHPDFRPELTPKEMLALGVFGGKYMTDCRREFPAAWFNRARLSPERHDYMGRRHPDDARQIARWRAVRRHVAQLKKHCMRGSLLCRPRQRQALLHWAYDSRRI